MVTIEDLKGHTVVRIEGGVAGSDVMKFITSEGKTFTLLHHQDCCEYVVIYDIEGDIDDLLNSPILISEESEGSYESGDYESQTWTFYRFATVKGWVVVRWLGQSNGYYSESVDFEYSENA